jgi:hypothetical protein
MPVSIPPTSALVKHGRGLVTDRQAAFARSNRVRSGRFAVPTIGEDVMDEQRPPAQRIRPPEPEPPEAPTPPSAPPLLAAVFQWTGKEARVLRIALRMPLGRFARHINAGRSTVTDWEAAADQLVLSWGMQDALDELLAHSSNECKKRFGMGCEGNPNVSVSDSSGPHGNGGDADRKHALLVIGGTGLVAVLELPEAVERIAADLRHPGRVDPHLVASHETLADALAVPHSALQPEVLGDQVARHADVLFKMLDRPMATPERRRLEAITVASHVQAGLLAFDASDRTTARRYFALAWDVADDADDDTLRARTLRVAQVLHSPIESGGRSGNAHRAAALMRRAVHYARRADPATRANIHRRLGLLFAAAEDERGFLTSYEAGDRIPDPPGEPNGPGFLARFFARPPEQVTNRGIGLVRIGRAEEAIDALRPTLNPADPGWTAMALTDIAAARVLQREPEQACRDLQHALTLALQAGYTMGIERLLGVRDSFPKPWTTLACVRKLDERLRALHHR